MRARIPEEFEHLDLSRGDFRRLRGHDPRVIDALLPQRRRAKIAAAAARRRGVAAAPWRRPPPAAGCASRVAGRFLDGFRSVLVVRLTAAAARPLIAGSTALAAAGPVRRAPGQRGGGPLRPARSPPTAACRTPQARRPRSRAQPVAVRAWSAKSLHIRGQIADVLGREALRDGRHDAARSRWARARCISRSTA